METGVIVRCQNLQDRTGNLQAPFDRLIGVRVRSHGDQAGLISRLGQFTFQQFGSIGFGKQPGLEIQSRRKP